MQEIIVLGQVPGTTIQLSFTSWLYIVLASTLLALILSVWREVATYLDVRRADVRATRIFETILQYRQF